MAKAKKDDRTQTDERAQLGSDEQAHAGVDHSHAGYLSQEDADSASSGHTATAAPRPRRSSP